MITKNRPEKYKKKNTLKNDDNGVRTYDFKPYIILQHRSLRSYHCVKTTTTNFCICSMFCCALFFAIISMGKRELVALLCLSSWCIVMVEWLFLTTPRVCLQFVNVVFPDHTHLLFKGDISFKSFYLHDFFSCIKKCFFLSRRRIPLATLLYEHFIHLTIFRSMLTQI